VTARSITVQLPPEPPPGSVVLVELANPAWADPVKLDRLAFQLQQEGLRTAWHMVGGEFNRPGLSWAQLIGLADGRPILVLWEPTEATP